jgi:predicted HAD superfamily Cof-like phosphohydrolase
MPIYFNLLTDDGTYITREERVKAFQDAGTAAGAPPTFESVWNCLSEEFLELQEAAMKFHEIIASDFDDDVKANARANFVKEWADVQYTLSGIANFYNIDGEEAFRRVSDNNLTKIVDGKVIIRESDGKILKPEGYEKPNMGGL